MSAKRKVFFTVAAVLLAFVGTTAFHRANRNTDGVVVELVNLRPVGGVHIALDCRRSKQFHGTESVRTAETQSGIDGHFSFSRSDIRDCGYVSITISKDGFRDAANIMDSAITVPFEISAEVPRYLYMVRESEVKQLQLQGLFNQSNAVRVSPVGPMPEDDYTTVNTKFFDSIRIASTSEEVLWVQEHYCDRLSTLWGNIPADEQQKHLAKKYANIVKYPDVVAYCQKKAKP